jgi:hypothetical protein
LRRSAIVGAVAAMVVVAPFASRADDANQACSDGQGVTIVVDFQALGGGVNVRCAAQPINNGFDVFRHANVSYETVTNSDFVCKIAAKPENADCSHTPPGNAYWSYWYARPGEEWHYSTYGPGSRKPPPGSYDGWSFSSGDKAPPRYGSPPAPATTTTTTTTAAPAETTTLVRSSHGTATATPHTDPATTTSTTSTPVAEASTPTPTSLALGHVDLSERGGGSGTSLGFVLSALAVTLLAAIGVAVVRGR